MTDVSGVPSQLHQATAATLLQIRPLPLPSTPFPIHYSLIITSCGADSFVRQLDFCVQGLRADVRKTAAVTVQTPAATPQQHLLWPGSEDTSWHAHSCGTPTSTEEPLQTSLNCNWPSLGTCRRLATSITWLGTIKPCFNNAGIISSLTTFRANSKRYKS